MELKKIRSDSWMGKVVFVFDEPELEGNGLIGVQLENGLMVAVPRDPMPEVGDLVMVFNLEFEVIPPPSKWSKTNHLNFKVFRKAERSR